MKKEIKNFIRTVYPPKKKKKSRPLGKNSFAPSFFSARGEVFTQEARAAHRVTAYRRIMASSPFQEDNTNNVQEESPPLFPTALRYMEFGDHALKYMAEDEFAEPGKAVPMIKDRSEFAELVAKEFDALCKDLRTNVVPASTTTNNARAVQFLGKEYIADGSIKDVADIDLSGAHHLAAIFGPDNEDEWSHFCTEIQDKFAEPCNDSDAGEGGNEMWYLRGVETSVPGVSCACKLYVEANHSYQEKDCKKILVEEGVLTDADSEYGCTVIGYAIQVFFNADSSAEKEEDRNKRGSEAFSEERSCDNEMKKKQRA